MAHSFANILLHVIFSTKDRQPWLEGESKPRVFQYMGGIARESQVPLLSLNGPADHIHAVIALPATLALADFLRIWKTDSSRWIHETWPDKQAFGWQNGYAAFSVSQSVCGDVKAYIARQEEHHRSVSFKDEYLAFLRRHGIEFDERYVFE